MNKLSEIDLNYSTSKLWNFLLEDNVAEKFCDDEKFDSDNYVSRMKTLVLSSTGLNRLNHDENMNKLLNGLERLVKTNSDISKYTSERADVLSRLIREDAAECRSPASFSSRVMEVLEISDNDIEQNDVKIIEIEAAKPVVDVKLVDLDSEIKLNKNSGI